ncbi:hypothetical protein TCAL_06588 [Tigriopus californicus]|uniref:chitin synthase n=1 Tax=Tigriopus californicus TaxID=6832 RepID=A0A553PPP4_TIGCA|nr:hypothetical protein TCAL_06588 [Tigriopus californicus]
MVTFDIAETTESFEPQPEHNGPQSIENGAPVEKWDAFIAEPPAIDTGSEAAMVWVRRFEKLMLIIAYILTFAIVITGVVVGKGVTMFMIAQVSPVDSRVLPYCKKGGQIIDKTKDYEIKKDRALYADSIETEQVAWVWCLFFAFAIPEVLSFLRASRILLFKKWERPKFLDFFFVLVMEVLHVIGVSMLVFLALPQLDSTHALALTNCLAVIPGIMLILSREPKRPKVVDNQNENENEENEENENGGNGQGNQSVKMPWVKVGVDALAILAQLSGALTWPILQWSKSSDTAEMKYAWAVPLGIILASAGWWECFVTEHSKVPIVKILHGVRVRMIDGTRYFTYLWISVIKVLVFFVVMWLIVMFNGVLIEPLNIFSKFTESFNQHGFNVTEIEDQILGGSRVTEDAFETKYEATIMTQRLIPLYVLLIQVGCTYGAYIFSKFACKVQIQEFSFALPLSMAVPACMTFVLVGCGFRAADECAFYGVVPDNLFFECPAIGDYLSYLWNEHMWLWALWFLSQLWITMHIWSPRSTRLASTEEIFGTPMYCSLFIDQSLTLNRRHDGKNDFTFEDMQADEQDEAQFNASPSTTFGEDEQAKRSDVKSKDKVTKIYGCATMWHETKDEMIEMLKSVFRIDKDYAQRKVNQEYYKTIDKDFYEWETHIFFDDAFEVDLEFDGGTRNVVNSFVKLLVRVMDEAASYVHGRNVMVKPPTKYPAPHGGRLVWTLPGKTKIVCHLKDKDLIRHKKRWSQCMYMYYLLGYKIMELACSTQRKEVLAENTFILALDGDIDFQPNAVTRLVDLMKKNEKLGAACGRIHPTGSGFMQWYQRFEYAIGHWLQKSTEHVLGCVLCSPGCFSLFRAQALMDKNVMKMYTTKSEKAMDFVQFDQGEDRWLCTLLLQRGWRVEYSAASDAFTACPEGFDEFYNQRRRWMPSTIANIFDVLSDYKSVTKQNDDISIFYIAYQMMMMVGTVLGPGTIFLMIVGAFTAAFSISNWTSFLVNLIPLLAFMFVCFALDSKIQLYMAQIMSAVYALVMMAVMVGIMLQIREDGFLAPTTLSIVLVGGSFILGAIVHPQEFWCLPYGLIYYITIPSMYLLLVIYSIFNMNVVSWGTREMPKKKSKAEIEEEKKKEEELKKETNKKKKDGSLLGFLMNQTDKSEKGSVEFSFANLFKCMCFTHEEADDPKKQLVKIAASLEQVNARLGKIEQDGPGNGGPLGAGFRRRSSTGRRVSRGSFTAPVPLPVNEKPSEGSLPEVNHLMEQSMDSSDSDSESNNNSSDEEESANFWIHDRELGNGQDNVLKGSEIIFWRKLIERYLQPLRKNEEKEKKQAQELLDLRNQMVFSFFMLNAVFVVVVFLLQQQKDLLFIRWPLGAKANVTYIGPKTNPVVEVDYEYLELEPIGVVFVVFFAFILILQVIGMLFHRWGTMSQIISTTRLLTRVVKLVSDEPTEERASYKKVRPNMGRRGTVHNLLEKQQEKSTSGPLDLQGDIKRKIMTMDPEHPAFKRLSVSQSGIAEFQRRASISIMQDQGQPILERERRRSILVENLDPGVYNMGLVGDDEVSRDADSDNSQE